MTTYPPPHCHHHRLARFRHFVHEYQSLLGILLAALIVAAAVYYRPCRLAAVAAPAPAPTYLVSPKCVRGFQKDLATSWGRSYLEAARDLREGKWVGYVARLKGHMEEESHAIWTAYFGDLLYNLKPDGTPSQAEMDQLARFYEDLGNEMTQP